MVILQPDEYQRVLPLIRSMEFHLPIKALLTGYVQGEVFVDQASQPRAALLRIKQRYYLCGDPIQRFVGELQSYFLDNVYAGRVEGVDEFRICYPPEWGAYLLQILESRQPILSQHQYFEIKTAPVQWRLPEGFEMRMVDKNLVEEKQLLHHDELLEEMCSERTSIEEFLEKSVGVCVIHNGELAGWCLSEYNTGERCEVGIATVTAYQRQGLATWMTRALVSEAYQRGIQRVGWHCYALNRPSAATALKAGLTKIADYEALIGIIDPVINLGAHGNTQFWRGEYEQAMAWYQQAIHLGNAPSWVYWNMACSAAHTKDPEVAFPILHQAIDRGFSDEERLVSSPHLQNLHGSPEWECILRRLRQ